MTRREITGIPLTNLVISQPSKRHSDRNKVTRLALNIKSTGQLNPLIVQRIPGEEKYKIVAGAMRALALRAAERTHADCIVLETELTEANAIKICRSENAQRFETNVMEDSRLVCRFMEASGLNGTDTARELGISVTEVSRCRERVYEWSSELQQLTEDERIAPSTAHAIQKIVDPAKKQEAMRLAPEGKLTRDAAFLKAQESRHGRPPSEKSNAARVKVALAEGAVTISGPELSPEKIVVLLTELLKRARRAMSSGSVGSAFVLALRDAAPSRKHGAKPLAPCVPPSVLLNTGAVRPSVG